MIPRMRSAGQVLLRKIGGRFDACTRLYSGATASLHRPTLLQTLAFVVLLIGLAVLHPVLHGWHMLAPMLIGATNPNNPSTADTVTSLADLYEKTNTDVKIGIKLTTEEHRWFRDYPRENITISGNENRVPILLQQPNSPAMIGDGAYEAIMITPAPTHGTFMPVQMSVRYGYTGLAQALTNRARSAMIQEQTAFQASMAIHSISRGIGLQTYGASSGTVAVVGTTGSAGTVQNGIALKNLYGSSTFVAGPSGLSANQLAALNQPFRVNDVIAIIRSGSLIEFATVNASPSAASGAGFIDATFQSSITPTAGDLLVFANHDQDATITGTDQNNWPYGFTDVLTGAPLGITSTSANPWKVGSSQTMAQRLGFAVKEKMINDCWNAAGVKINRFIVSQGARRDAIAGELGGRRYDSAETDIEGDLKPGQGEKFFTSQLAFPATMIGWYDKAYSKIELSDLPEEGGGKSIFKIDKVQAKTAYAANYDYFYQKIPSSLAATGYATNLTESP